MADVSVRFNRAALETQARAGLRVDMRRRGNRVLNAARRNVSVDTGATRASLWLRVDDTATGVVAVVGSNRPSARYEEEGTGIYAGRGYIYPKRGQFLVFPARNNSGSGNRRYRGGATANLVFARRVRGRKGTRFLSRALDAAR